MKNSITLNRAFGLWQFLDMKSVTQIKTTRHLRTEEVKAALAPC